MQANRMQPMQYSPSFDGPFSVAAPLANGGGFMQRMMGQFQGGYGQPHPQPGGYDSSGINPHGMYNGTFNHPQQPFPQNPGGFQPIGLPRLMQFNRPTGLAAMFAR